MPTLSRPSATIYYESHGAESGKQTVVFAHGAGGNAGIWFNQIAHFVPQYHCIAFDHRYFARSAATGDINVHDFRDDLLAILDELDVETAHLVGQSMGGFTVLRCALDAPDRVSTLSLSCTTGGIINPNPSPAMQSLTQSSGRNTNGVIATMSKATAQKPELLQLYEAINAFNVEFSWDKLRTLLSREDIVQPADLAAVQCPVLFISGEEDPLFAPELLASYVPHFPNARIEIVSGAGHSPYFEQPSVFNHLLTQHLNSHKN